ncbi:MAG: metal-dependent phosphohydrolase [Paenibacillaceae bacterium ZCTH02-B3]|nr:MAG: metal-dependent phosphohydrolase [Paenibacillaceae bacterium ZCTH02-B3]
MPRKRYGKTGGRAFAAVSPSAGWKQNAALRWVLFLLFVGLFYVSLAPRFVPPTYDIRLGAVSDRDIRAPRQEIDEEATIRAREAAAERVQTVYTIVSVRNETLVDEMFRRIDQLNRDEVLSTDDKVDIYRREFPSKLDQHVDAFIQANAGTDTYSPELLQEMRRSVLEQKYAIPEETFYKLPRLTSAQIAEMRLVARDVVRQIMSSPLSDAESARTQVAELVNASPLSLTIEREVVQELARYAITPNRFADEAATEAARKEAMENTPPVVIKQGDVIVGKGQVITEDVYALLEKFNLLKEKKTYLPQVGVIVMSLLLGGALYGYGRLSAEPGGAARTWTNMHWLMLLTIFALNALLMHLTALARGDGWTLLVYAAPVATGSMLVTLLLGSHWGLASSVAFSVLAAAILNVEQETLFDFRYGLMGLAVCLTAVFAVHRASQRFTLLKAGFLVGLAGALAAVAMMMAAPEPDTGKMLQAAGFAMAGGLLTAVLVIGLMPFFESLFGVLSALKLVELSNPNHPLLRRLLTEAPGTYHHSLMVGNLAEAAAEAVGANGLLCRVGSFYHDVGKTKRPRYFIENQNGGENPHDRLDPKVSAGIIIAHARDGAEMLKAYRLPKPIRDIAEQHHGTTLLKYFYQKMLQEAEAKGAEPEWSEADFRYPGPKAQSKEAAIVGIADSVEAAVRSLKHPTVEQIKGIIGKIIKERLDDGQLSECDLTLRELDTIANSMLETVIGMFHSRIDYPEDHALQRRKEGEAGAEAEAATASAPASEQAQAWPKERRAWR